MTPLDSLPTDANGFRLRGLETTRIETFTDAAFAFALTLLVVSLEPPTSLAGMDAALRNVPAFVVSATLLMTFWWGHHEWSRRYGLDDGATIVLSCLLVFTVLVYVYPLRFMFGLMMRWIGMMTGWPIGATDLAIEAPEDVNRIFAIYGLGFLAMSLALSLLNLHAWRRRDALRLNAIERHDTLTAVGVWLVLAGAGALSIALALVLPPTWYGVPGWAYGLIPFAMMVLTRRAARRRPAPDPGGGASD